MISRSFAKPSISIFLFLFIETLLFIGLSTVIGFGWAMLLSIGTTTLGWFIRPKLWKSCLENLGQGQIPPITSCYHKSQWQRLSASFLLILPGFLTDFVGLTILIPPVWKVLVSSIGKRFLHFLSKQGSHPAGRVRHSHHPTNRTLNPRRLDGITGLQENFRRQNTIEVDVIVIKKKTKEESIKTKEETQNYSIPPSKRDESDIIEVDYEWL